MSKTNIDPAFLAELDAAYDAAALKSVSEQGSRSSRIDFGEAKLAGLRAVFPAIEARAREAALREAAKLCDYVAQDRGVVANACADRIRELLSAPPVAEPARAEPIGSEGPALHDRIHPTSGRLLHAAPILPARAEPDEAVRLTEEELELLDSAASSAGYALPRGLPRTVERIIAQRLATRRGTP